mmetsp:Transcript_12380/g.29459  ORF Transcript_12380/g.29459 Transcript_12380/m.29459 type:complete len:119 (+) Transcript_12380:1110-1466(+)
MHLSSCRLLTRCYLMMASGLCMTFNRQVYTQRTRTLISIGLAVEATTASTPTHCASILPQVTGSEAMIESICDASNIGQIKVSSAGAEIDKYKLNCSYSHDPMFKLAIRVHSPPPAGA